MIEYKDAKLTAFRGDYHPVELYKGDVKVAGYKKITKNTHLKQTYYIGNENHSETFDDYTSDNWTSDIGDFSTPNGDYSWFAIKNISSVSKPKVGNSIVKEVDGENLKNIPTYVHGNALAVQGRSKTASMTYTLPEVITEGKLYFNTDVFCYTNYVQDGATIIFKDSNENAIVTLNIDGSNRNEWNKTSLVAETTDYLNFRSSIKQLGTEAGFHIDATIDLSTNIMTLLYDSIDHREFTRKVDTLLVSIAEGSAISSIEIKSNTARSSKYAGIAIDNTVCYSEVSVDNDNKTDRFEFDDTYNDAPKVSFIGECYQDTVGENLFFDENLIDRGRTGAQDIPLDFLEDGIQYTISCRNDVANSSIMLVRGMKTADDTVGIEIAAFRFASLGVGEFKKNFTVDFSKYDHYIIRYYAASSNTIYDIKIGVSMPSLDNPSEIKSSGMYDEVTECYRYNIVSHTENMLDYERIFSMYPNLAYVNNYGIKYLTFEGILGQGDVKLMEGCFKRNTTYTFYFSMKTNVLNDAVFFCQYDDGTVGTVLIGDSTATKYRLIINVAKDKAIKYWGILQNNKETITKLNCSNFQILEGEYARVSILPKYEKGKLRRAYLDLEQPLYRINDYVDVVEIDTDKKTATITRNCRRVVIDNFYTTTYTGEIGTCANYDAKDGVHNGICYCSHMLSGKAPNTYNGMRLYSGVLQFGIKWSDLDVDYDENRTRQENTDICNKWLNSLPEPLVVVYPLSTPVIEDVSDKIDWDELQTFYPYTHFTVMCGELGQATIECKVIDTEV